MNSRISPIVGEQVPEESRAILKQIEKALGMIPNLHRTLAQAPAALKGYVATVQALSGGILPAALREQIAVASAGTNGCGYCASAHTLLGKNARIPEGELTRNLSSESSDPKVAAALVFTRALIEQRGAVSDAALAAVRDAGYSEQEIIEITAHVGMNWFTNVFNLLAQTEIDFPEVEVCAVRRNGEPRS